MRTGRFVLAGALAVAASLACPRRTAGADAPIVVFDMGSVRHRPTAVGKAKTPTGTAELVEGKVGKACKFTFAADARSGFFTSGVRPTPAWDQAAGISFWVKGDGSDSWGGIELIDGSDYALRYAFCFPTDSREWRKITVPWCDFIPELPKGQVVDAKSGYAPSRFGNFWFGKWWYWRDYPAHSFTIDQVALEPSIDLAQPPLPPAGGAPRLLAKLKARKPVTIVTMGDSLSDKRHWANRQVLWSELLVAKLKSTYGADATLVNPAIGGTLLTQNLVLMPRWLKANPEPDLVAVWFGFNDWSSGMRGQRFVEMLRLAVDRIRRLTGGKSEVMLITTCPAVARWDTMDELAEAVRTVAREKRTALADVAGAFKRAGAAEPKRLELFCRDKTHLGNAGHTLAADTVVAAIAAGK